VPGYEIVSEIGRGGMGVVYKALEPSLGRHVALKFLPAEYARDPERLERFRREARTASALNHPHICTVHALGEHEGRPFLVMELIEGVTLRGLANRGPKVAEATPLVGQAARALAAAHAAGVVHRDVKPENIMVRGDGYVKVVDFGLARRLPSLAHPDPGGCDTDPGILLGTAAYMAPEQARGEPAESASDVFSLGIVLYQLVTGRHPFEADSALGMLYAIVTRPPVPPSRLNAEIPTPLEGLLGAMLHKDARLRPTAAEVVAALAALAERPEARPARSATARPIVRREPELAALRAVLAEADAGRARVVCVTGEPGLGKTTLVEDFLDELAAPGPGCRVARGRCSERLAGSEAYLPVLEALSELLRTDASGSVARLLRVVAPAWYAQVAVDAGPSQALSQQAMLRELTGFLQETSRLGPVVLFFDDVHWADLSTVDLLAHLGRHCRGLRVLVVVTCRPTELLLGPHAFRRVQLELQGQGVCTELALGFLGRSDLDRYLALAFPGHALPADFVDLIYSRTEGSPLFLTDLLRYLRERGVIAESGGRWVLGHPLPDLRHELPESVRGMIQRTLGRLDEADRRLLGAASVQGHEFDSAAVAGALRLDAADVEDRLQVLDRVHGLVRPVREYEMPDRTLTLRYAFVHVLYQQALYADLQPTGRAALSLAVAETLQSHHGEGNQTVAAELACLFEVGRDFGRAAWQFWLAAQNAARVFAHREAVGLARRGLRLLTALPETPGRAALELPLQTVLGLQLQVTEGYAAAAAHQAYTRARQLCPQAPGSAPPFSVVWGLWLYHKVRSELTRAQELAGELLTLAGDLGEPSLALQAHQALGLTALCRGEPTVALRHVEQAAALYDPVRHSTHALLFGQDPGGICKAYGAVALWLLGYPDTAERQSDAAIAMSRVLSPTSQAVALHFAAMLHQLRRAGPRAGACAGASAAVAGEHGFSFWLAGSAVLGGWAQAAAGAVDEGVERLRRGLADWQATGSVTYRTYYLGLLAEGLGWQGRIDEGVRVLDEALALVRETGEGLCEAELYRLRGELLLRAAGAVPRAEEDFRRALDVARRSRAKSLELRAAMSLVRLGQRLGESEADRRLLAETLGWFTEGFQTPDLREAKALVPGKS
jgi:predicted ATPase